MTTHSTVLTDSTHSSDMKHTQGNRQCIRVKTKMLDIPSLLCIEKNHIQITEKSYEHGILATSYSL